MKKMIFAAIAAVCLLSEPVHAERFLPRGDKPNNVYGVRNYRQGMTGLRGNRQQIMGRRLQARNLYGFKVHSNRIAGVRRPKNYFGTLRFR